ncbi:MAG: hydrogenase maturation protease [Chloroflexota bacterium]
MKTLIIGLGNPILGDDGVGWRVAEEVKRGLEIGELETKSPILQSLIDVDCFSLGGLSLMERMIGYDRAILIDAVTTGQPPGTVYRFQLEDLPEVSCAHTTAAHDTSLQNALKLGRRMGAKLPSSVAVVGVEAERLYDFGEKLTPAVEAAVPQAVRAVMEIVSSLLEEA